MIDVEGELEAIMFRIRQEVASRQAESGAAVQTPVPSPDSHAAWSEFEGRLRLAERQAGIATFVPDWPHWPRPKNGGSPGWWPA